MDEINKSYDQLCQAPSDINEHLPVLRRYALECEHITEMGVRWVTSTWAFMAAQPKKIISYDIVKHANISNVVNLARKYSIDFVFIEADVLKINISPTDLLFIDTLHTYEQLKAELTLHSKQVKKYIVFHDTVTFGKMGEKLYDHASDLVKNGSSGKGIRYAIDEFLLANPQWKVREELPNNNGLMIIEKSHDENSLSY